ncbi:MAG: hypothetical protein PWQ70_1245 [Clostridiales bacterium]|nr:hypothetical protein [Clostridiales bacterium]
MGQYSNELLEIVKRLPRYSKLLYKLYRSSGLKKSHRMMLYGAIGYIVSPIDLIPGVIPVLGQLDDILVVLTVLYKVITSYKEDRFKEMLEECNLTINIVQEDIKTIKNYAKLVGISTAKILAHGAAAIGSKGLKTLKKYSPLGVRY